MRSVGDKVIFGAYGYFDNDDVWTITQVDTCDKFLGGVQYHLEKDGSSVVAFADEIKLVEA